MNRLQRRKLRKLHEAVCRMDLAYIRKHWPAPFEPSNEQVFLASIHKARNVLPMATPEQRAESEAWLKENGFNKFNGTPEGFSWEELQ